MFAQIVIFEAWVQGICIEGEAVGMVFVVWLVRRGSKQREISFHHGCLVE